MDIGTGTGPETSFDHSCGARMQRLKKSSRATETSPPTMGHDELSNPKRDSQATLKGDSESNPMKIGRLPAP